MTALPFTLPALSAAYAGGEVTPAQVAAEALRRAAAQAGACVWITLREEADVVAEAEALTGQDRAALPLYGIPFAVKDNIDVAGLPTTAACPDFAYTPTDDAPVVAALRAAGAIVIGKTNLDQFATGLVGVRSPYGACQNPFNPAYISGGSSSGSAVAVAGGAVAFSLGTDTAGSGRVPAAFCNLVGWKGTRGLVSARGVVPACRSLDCVTVFAHRCGEAAAIAGVASRFDPLDGFARPMPSPPPALPPLSRLRLGVPRAADLAFFGNPHTPGLFAAMVERFTRLGARVVEVDLQPFLEAARLLYEGPWVAERTAAVGGFLAEHPGAGHPVVRQIIEGGQRFSAVEAYQAQYRLRDLARHCETVWDRVDAILTPTAGTIYTIAEVEADPLRLNSTLGYYTNFMNLLDLSAVALPAGFQPDGLPFGVTLFAPAFQDDALLTLGAQVEDQGMVDLVVFGAHMQGLPLSGQLLERGARLLGPVQTAPHYRFYAFETLSPPRPGLVRVEADGAAIAGELWQVPAAHLGSFLAGIAAPLALGQVELSDGRWKTGFLCEAQAVGGAKDITELGGWRRYRGE